MIVAPILPDRELRSGAPVHLPGLGGDTGYRLRHLRNEETNYTGEWALAEAIITA